MPSLKETAFWWFMTLAFFTGLAIAATVVALSVPVKQEPRLIDITIHHKYPAEHDPYLIVEVPAPGNDRELIPPRAEGKRRFGVSPETKRKMELMEIFNGRDPFERVR